MTPVPTAEENLFYMPPSDREEEARIGAIRRKAGEEAGAVPHKPWCNRALNPSFRECFCVDIEAYRAWLADPARTPEDRSVSVPHNLRARLAAANSDVAARRAQAILHDIPRPPLDEEALAEMSWRIPHQRGSLWAQRAVEWTESGNDEPFKFHPKVELLKRQRDDAQAAAARAQSVLDAAEESPLLPTPWATKEYRRTMADEVEFRAEAIAELKALAARLDGFDPPYKWPDGKRDDYEAALGGSSMRAEIGSVRWWLKYAIKDRLREDRKRAEAAEKNESG